MADNQSSSSRILLLGLEDHSLSQLATILSEQDHAVCSRPFVSTPESLALIEGLGADVVYCAADPDQYSSLVEAVREQGSLVPVVVVSCEPSLSEWLDAIEAGAWDYVGLPFESNHLRHVLENALRFSAVEN